MSDSAPGHFPPPSAPPPSAPPMDPPALRDDVDEHEEHDDRIAWQRPLALFLATVAAAYFTQGWAFTAALMLILLFHEFGHWIAARIHKVPASLPYFIPLPILSPFGTMGAVIAMRGRIRSRNALLDIGAAGPLAGMVVAIPVLALGLSLSRVMPRVADGYQMEGQSLLYLALKRLVLGPIPDTHDVYLHPVAFAGWAGLLVTMINLLPWGQLDGGHIAYALLGPKQNRIARWVRYSLLPLFGYNLYLYVWPKLTGESNVHWYFAIMNSVFWLMWFLITGLIGRLSGSADHPPTDDDQLSPKRKAIAVFCAILFVLLFMPMSPLAVFMSEMPDF